MGFFGMGWFFSENLWFFHVKSRKNLKTSWNQVGTYMWGIYIIEEKMSDQNKWLGWRLGLEKGRFWGETAKKCLNRAKIWLLPQDQANTDSKHICDDFRLWQRRKLIWISDLAEDWDSNMVNFGEKTVKKSLNRARILVLTKKLYCTTDKSSKRSEISGSAIFPKIETHETDILA